MPEVDSNDRKINYDLIKPLIEAVNDFIGKSDELLSPPFIFICANEDKEVKAICLGCPDDYESLLATVAADNDSIFASMRSALAKVVSKKFTEHVKARMIELGALDADGNPTANAAELLAADLARQVEEERAKLQTQDQPQPKDEPEVEAKKFH